ncbi:MAG: PEP/pyruvate-binding domain-containing protein [Thermodesulfobacteriota bacterium]
MSPLWPLSKTGNTTAADAFVALFGHFRRIVTTNNRILEMIADLERVLGGDYVYDRTFLQTSVNAIVEKGRQVIYNLNAMTGDRYQKLYDQLTIIADHLADILAGGAGPYGAQLVLGWDTLHRDLRHLAGGKGACLGEVTNSLALPVPGGFVVSTTGYHRLMEANDLFVRCNHILRQTADGAERAKKINALFASARLPADLAKAIARAVKELRRGPAAPERFAVRSSGMEEDGERSFAGQFQSLLDVAADEVAAACLTVMASRFSERVLRYLDPATPAEEAPMAVLVQPMLSPRVSGVLYTRDPNHPDADVMVISAISGMGDQLVAGLDSGDRYLLRRTHPFTLTASTIAGHRPLAADDDSKPTAPVDGRLRRGSAIARLAQLRQLAEYGIILEKHFESPQDIEWSLDQHGHLWILQSRPLRLLSGGASPRPPATISAELATLPVLLADRGSICHMGLASGPVMQVNDGTPAERFPVGAIAVSHFASPGLAEIVRRAGAIITDIGSPTGHLATVTREYRTPALFGVEQATALLTDGMAITVDVEERTIYAGTVELPPDLHQSGAFESLLDDKESRLLRRLLRLIAPLHLINPASSDFRMEGCRTIHDVLRFCHEKAVAELIGFHTSSRMTADRNAPLLTADIPLKIRILDVGDGLIAPAQTTVASDQVRSRPFRALLRGMLRPDAWSREPAPFGFRDFLAGLSNPLSMLTNAPPYSGENLAIIADSYCNLSLRLGYHFNIIDSYLSAEAEDNYAYFRFLGGFAEANKRRRRARLIGQVLTGMQFKVEIKGDLVQGKAKMLEAAHLEAILVRLGELIAFTRQLDVKMADDEAIDRFFADFLQRIRHEQQEGASKP